MSPRYRAHRGFTGGLSQATCFLPEPTKVAHYLSGAVRNLAKYPDFTNHAHRVCLRVTERNRVYK